MHWIEEVKIAKSIDDLMTSQSFTGRRDFPDYDMLDAMIASKYDRFLRGRQIAYMIYEHFRATGADEAVRLLSRFRRSMGSSSVIRQRHAFSRDPGRIVLVKIRGFCSARTMDRQVIYD